MNLMSMMPLARTPMDKDGSRALSDYQKTLVKEFDKMTPWLTAAKRSDLSSLRKKYKSGTTVVIPDASDGANNPIYKDATIRKDQ
jgi:hypothetical protein